MPEQPEPKMPYAEGNPQGLTARPGLPQMPIAFVKLAAIRAGQIVNQENYPERVYGE